MHKVFVTRKIPQKGLDLLEERGYDVVVAPQAGVIERDELLAGVQGADALLSILTDTIDEEVFLHGHNLKVVANYAVGFNNIDLKAAEAHNVHVSNAPSEKISESVAEHVIALMLAISRRVVEADHFTRDGMYNGWGPMMFLGNDLQGKTVGIVGLGAIGRRVAHILHHGFGMNVLYHSRTADEDFNQEYNAEFVSKEDLLRRSDYVSLHVPLLDSTHHWIDEEALNMMKPSAFLINTARGPVIDELALTKALYEDRIAGAALDVFESEPAIDVNPDDHYDITTLNNIILTPHIASATLETREAMAVQAAKNIIAVLEGGEPINPVG
jgi:glyoxylate reductase